MVPLTFSSFINKDDKVTDLRPIHRGGVYPHQHKTNDKNFNYKKMHPADMKNEPVIDVCNVHKSFKNVCAVKGIDFKIFKGQSVALLGPNGAGKTTLMEMIEGIQKPDTGDIFINEINTLPGFTQTSMYPMLWQASGTDFETLVDQLVQFGFERSQ